MGTLLDTSTLILLESQHLTGRLTLLDESRNDLFIAAITLSELLVGVYRSHAKRRAQRQQFVDHVLAHTVLLPFDAPTAVTHARVYAQLQTAGRAVPQHDLMIAATAVHHGYEVMTLDQRSFPHIPGVRLAAMPQLSGPS